MVQLTCRHVPLTDGGAVVGELDEVFVHSFYWDALQDPALTVQVAALIQTVQQALLAATRRAAPCPQPLHMQAIVRQSLRLTSTPGSP